MSLINRRAFVQGAALGGGAVLAPSLTGLAACSGLSRPVRSDGGAGHRQAGRGEGGYGELAPSADCPQLALPRGFHCVVLSESGRPMSNGAPTPNAFDGMAAFRRRGGGVRLIRNHEMRDSAANAEPFGDKALAYDSKCGGGTTTLDVQVRRDGTRELVREFVSLTGTHVNCAGGPTPWGSWITCEETTEGEAAGRTRPHGYVFDVPVSAEREVEPVPLKGMGRFVHEAVAVDPATNTVYLTEDRAYVAGNPAQPGAGFYRFVPSDRRNMAAGGRLQMLAIDGRPNYNTVTGQQLGQVLPVVWVDIADPDPADAATDPAAVLRQGMARGGAIFQRLEGCWYGDRGIFFNSTSGGDAGAGQVWQYVPRGRTQGRLSLVFESPSGDVLSGPDNIVVSPRGGIVLCEDGGGADYVRGLTRGGAIFDVALNLANNNEFCGACFSPDGETLFVNVQGSTTRSGAVKSMTFAIWGPWRDGAL